MCELLTSNNLLSPYHENEKANPGMVKEKIKQYKKELLSNRDENDPLMQGLSISSISNLRHASQK